jgi:hypothetical protein
LRRKRTPEIVLIGEEEDVVNGTLIKRYRLTCSIKITSNGVSEIASTGQELIDVCYLIYWDPIEDSWE